jgi:WD40 repeat protein
MTAGIVALLLTVTAVSVASAWRIASARKGEQREAYYSNIALANQYIEQGSIDRALETLWKCPEQYRHWEWGHLLYLCHQEAASFQAHTTNIWATVFSPDGRWVGTHDAAGLAKVWDWETEQVVFSFGSSSNRASWVTFRPSGGQLAAILGTNGVWVWTTTNWTSSSVGTRSTASLTSGNVTGADSGAVIETEKHAPLFTLHPLSGEITTLAYSADGARLVTGGSDGTVTVWDSASGKELNRFATTNQSIGRVAISPDGQRVVAVAVRAAWVWELQSGKLIRTFPEDLVAADVSRRTSSAQEVSADSRPRLREEKGLTPPAPSETSSSRVSAVFADDTGKHFAIVDQEGGLTLWREGCPPLRLITIRTSAPWAGRGVFFSPDGRWMANAGDDNTARVWDLATGVERLAISERVQWVDFSRDGNRMVTHGTENWVTTWDLVQARKLKVLRGHLTVVDDARLSADGRLVVSAEQKGIVKVWSAGPGRELAQDRAWQNGCACSPDGRLIANCPWHEGVIVRSARSGRELLRIHTHNEGFLAVAFSPDSRRLVTAGSQKTAKVWDAETGQLLLRLRGHRRQLRSVAYSSDGRRIATGSFDNTAKVWDANTGNELLTLPMDPVGGYALMGLNNFVRSVEFDAKAERLVTGSSDCMARIWDSVTGQLIATFDGGEPGFRIVKAHFLTDQRNLITGFNSRIQVWDVSTGRLVVEATGRGADRGWGFSQDGRRMFTASGEAPNYTPAFGHGTLEIWDFEESPRRILDRAGREPFTSLALSPDDRNVACAAVDYCVHRWETFPWRKEEYVAKAEGRSQKSEVSKSGPRTEWAAMARQYARSYWRERLQAEFHGVEGEPAEPRVVEVPIDRTLLPKRDPRARGTQLDLTDFYTGELGETFHGKVASVQDHDDDLSELRVGLVELGGVEFDVRGVIQLRRADLRGAAWEFPTLDDPVRVDGILVQQEATRLHLLLGTVRGEGTVPSEATVIGRLELHYTDGETRSLDLVYGRDVREWWYEPARFDTEATDRASVVWTGKNPVANEYGHRLRLYLNTRENPRPGLKITTFDFVSAMSESGPFLIAVTVE